MEESERLRKQKELIEYIGIQHQREGYQPVAARIVGLLMVMDKEEYTFEEIVEEMQISKSAVSMALKNLEIRGMIEYVTYPGDRKRYFRFVSNRTDGIFIEIQDKLKQNLETIRQIIELKKDPASRNALFLKNLYSGMDFFARKMDDLKREYNSQQ